MAEQFSMMAVIVVKLLFIREGDVPPLESIALTCRRFKVQSLASHVKKIVEKITGKTILSEETILALKIVESSSTFNINNFFKCIISF